jgi:coenzyme F420-reducing hydrogenase alpha subunit
MGAGFPGRDVKTRTIAVNELTRVEGRGALRATLNGAVVRELTLEIFEPPRYFEALLVGRSFRDAPDVTARICGICPVAYQMSAVHALEAAAGVRVEGALRDLRRLLYCGEWIESHALHIHMLHAPDFLGHPDAIQLARAEPGPVERGLAIKQAGNLIVACIGGREIHPVNVCVGGFHRLPSVTALAALRDPLLAARDAAIDAARWVAGFDFPEHTVDVPLVALWHPDEYPMNEGRIRSTVGFDISAAEFDDAIVETAVAHSTALHARLRSGEAYLTGPLARFALNRERLAPMARALAAELELEASCRNAYRSIVVRAVEVVHAFETALEILARYEPPARAALAIDPSDAQGAWATEAPRGLLWHRYDIDHTGDIAAARIVPPTSQNQTSIEADLRRLIGAHAQDDDATLARVCERAIRNYDPCISCATHFLRLDIDRVRREPA